MDPHSKGGFVPEEEGMGKGGMILTFICTPNHMNAIVNAIYLVRESVIF